jgi:hypothetical protein
MEDKSVGGTLMFTGRIGFKWLRIEVSTEVLSRVWGEVHKFSKHVQLSKNFRRQKDGIQQVPH